MSPGVRLFLWRLASACGTAILLGLAAAMVSIALQRSAHGAETFRGAGTNGQPFSLRLSEAPCSDARVLEHLRAKLPSHMVAEFKAATLHWGGRDWASCWTEIVLVDQTGREHKSVFSVDEEGDPLNPPYGIPRRHFREDTI